MTGRKWFGLLVGAAAAVVASSLVLRVNVSPSVPEGIYLVVRGGELARGDFIEHCQPEAVQAYASRRGDAGSCPDGALPSIKPIAAVAGDVVVTSMAGIEVNGVQVQHSAPLAGIPRVPDGIYTVAVGEVWLISSYNPASLDSRYYGARPTSAILRKVTPIYTWGLWTSDPNSSWNARPVLRIRQ
jgi:conjugative transfer signal peptidase TraF